jgi:hypothetical protein
VRVQLEGELQALAAGELPAVEPLAVEREALPLVIAVGVTAILDFYHAAQNLYKGASAWLDGRTRAPASRGLPIYVTGCGMATSSTC